MSTADDSYPELHRLIDQLIPTQADELRRHALRLVSSNTGDEQPHRLSFTGIGSSPNPRLGAEAKKIIRTELRGTDA